MGAEYYHDKISIKGLTMQQAFDKLLEKAQYDYGHRGYTGSLAEKTSFRVLTVPSTVNTDEQFDDWKDKMACDDNKWGPAIATVYNNEYHFFGYASA